MGETSAGDRVDEEDNSGGVPDSRDGKPVPKQVQLEGSCLYCQKDKGDLDRISCAVCKRTIHAECAMVDGKPIAAIWTTKKFRDVDKVCMDCGEIDSKYQRLLLY